MKIQLVIIMVYCFTGGCSIKTCSVNTSANIREFKDYIDRISRFEYGKSGSILVDEYNDATLYLSLVTGLGSSAGYSGDIGYHTNVEFESDKKKYLTWLRENKCKLTDPYVDSALSGLLIRNKWLSK